MSTFFVDLRQGSPASPEYPAFLGVLFVVQGGEALKRNEAIALAACSQLLVAKVSIAA